MMISRNNHARHCSEFVAANFSQHIKQAVGIWLINFKRTANSFNFAYIFFVGNIGAAPRDFSRCQIKISGSHSGGNSRIANAHFANKKTVTARRDCLFR